MRRYSIDQERRHKMNTIISDGRFAYVRCLKELHKLFLNNTFYQCDCDDFLYSIEVFNFRGFSSNNDNLYGSIFLEKGSVDFDHVVTMHKLGELLM